MGQILPGRARTTAAVRRVIQRSQESLKTLAERHGINAKTVAKWKRDCVHEVYTRSDRLLPSRHRRSPDRGRPALFVAIDRTSKFAYAERHDQSDRRLATAFLRNLIEAGPYKIHTVLTDHGSRSIELPMMTTSPFRAWWSSFVSSGRFSLASEAFSS